MFNRHWRTRGWSPVDRGNVVNDHFGQIRDVYIRNDHSKIFGAAIDAVDIFAPSVSPHFVIVSEITRYMNEKEQEMWFDKKHFAGQDKGICSGLASKVCLDLQKIDQAARGRLGKTLNIPIIRLYDPFWSVYQHVYLNVGGPLQDSVGPLSDDSISQTEKLLRDLKKED